MRPSWAQGPEWEGWTAGCKGDRMVPKEMPESMCVTRGGSLWIFNTEGHTVILPYDSPDIARDKAEALMDGLR